MQKINKCPLYKQRGLGVPVAVGGVGGSGTRVVAELMQSLGLYMGNELNTASDNLWFTLLFRRPRWYLAHRADFMGEATQAMSIFDRAMRGTGEFDADDFRFVVEAFEEVARIHNSYMRPLKWATSLINATMMPVPPKRGDGWGWKEPNTHIYLEQLNAYYGDIKYVHVIRHGLDMAFSRNQFQLMTWGPIFGLPTSGPIGILPKVALDYWIMANERAISFGERELGERFLLIRFEDLCASPEEGFGKLADFLGFSLDAHEIKRLTATIRRPESSMRYKKHSLELFEPRQLAAVEELGFTI